MILDAHGVTVDVCVTSVLQRACGTAWRALEGAQQAFVPVAHDWRLNERMYGAVQGLSKRETAERLGEHAVGAFRKGVRVCAVFGASPACSADGGVFTVDTCVKRGGNVVGRWTRFCRLNPRDYVSFSPPPFRIRSGPRGRRRWTRRTRTTRCCTATGGTRASRCRRARASPTRPCASASATTTSCCRTCARASRRLSRA